MFNTSQTTRSFTEGTDKPTQNTSSVNQNIEGIVSEWLWKTIPVVLFCVGITGNVLTITVLNRLGLRRQPTLTFLMFLSITDTVILLTVLPRYWMLYTFNFDLKLVSSANCKLYYFVVYLSMQYSSWILVGVSIERAIKTHFPFKYKRWYTRQRVQIGLFITLFLLILLNVHFFITNGINDKLECGSLTEKDKIFDEFIYVYIDLCVESLIPFLIMLLCNIFLIRILRKSQKQRPSMMHDRYVQRANMFSVKMTKMLVVCTTYFIFATAPLCIYFIIESYLKPRYTQSYNEAAMATMGLVWTVCYLICLSNYCVNFYLYTALNERFYQEFRALLRCQPRTSLRRACVYTTKHLNTTCRNAVDTSQGIEQSLSDEETPINAASNTNTEKRIITE
ncbi:histamine H2 receptor-like [Dreissena polymorpha]|uniref:G-protein coupled receptors family 1 profile domain-containing protein n=1 Tax=Dreissena polymorpha TaxID=45954 RepID=A0A9D4ENZ9_DREPO|nr:histamine H2 receptor-like [Dreissena polymorpha]KAH3781397.1 hypothetical protein DPMN_159224 [Dreissena polymorpha]